MSFTQIQKQNHMKATQTLSAIESLRELIDESVSENDKEILRGRLMQKQVDYADIMRALTEKYIPFQMQLPNVVAVGVFERCEHE